MAKSYRDLKNLIYCRRVREKIRFPLINISCWYTMRCKAITKTNVLMSVIKLKCRKFFCFYSSSLNHDILGEVSIGNSLDRNRKKQSRRTSQNNHNPDESNQPRGKKHLKKRTEQNPQPLKILCCICKRDVFTSSWLHAYRGRGQTYHFREIFAVL